MPSAVLTSRSTLLTPSGWAETSSSGLIAAIGVDRHGQLSVGDIEVQISEESTANHFLGTRAAFGAFHAESILIDAEGTQRLASSLCNEEDVKPIKWESCVYDSDLLALKTGPDELWDAFREVALAGNGETMVLRAPRPKSAHGNRFVEMHKTRLAQEWVASGFAGLEASIASICGADTNLISVERRAYRLALWFATCRKAIGEGYRFGFDSIQHSCAIAVDSANGVGQVEALRTAFLAGTANRALISWADRSWNPVSSGFVLGARKP